MEHSKFSPSAVDAWKYSRCPAYVNHQDKDSKANIHMATGTVWHWVAENNLKYGSDIQACVGEKYKSDNFEIEFTQEFADHVEFYTAVIGEIRDENPNADMFVEHRVSLDHLNYPEVFGTEDVLVTEIFGNLIVVDLKSGMGKSVPADAGQLKLYAVMSAGNMIHNFEKIVTVVVQPRDVHGEKVKVVEHDPYELEQWVQDEVIRAVEDANSANPTYRPSKESCQWCDYKGQCRAQSEYALSLLNLDFEGVPDFNNIKNPKEMTSEDISLILKNESFLLDWLDSIKTIATECLLRNVDIPGFKLVESITRRQWNPDIDVEHILYKELKIRKKDLFIKKLKSPTQLLDMNEKKPDIKKRIEELIIKPNGHPKIAPASDRRESVTRSAEADFANI